MIKQREELQKIYADAGRADLAQQEAEEIVIIREYLPKQLSDTEMQKAVADAIAASGASSIKDMGKVMGALKVEICRPNGFRQGRRGCESEAR